MPERQLGAGEIAVWLRSIRGSIAIVELAERTGQPRFSVSRWLSGHRQADHWFLASHAVDLIAFALTIALITRLTAKLVAYQERVAAPEVRVVSKSQLDD